ncbi:isoform CRA b [Zalerion maritima]|uniref:Isoform CRA b n=1 Tax=Zalerion maritima TaxID=339359 RepID=A0AAD5RYY7_9PEZI|nr:isoform CRA b [Zalerion maritima]
MPQAKRFSSLSFEDEETIYAVSTPKGKAGIAVIRISGSSCLDIYKSLCPSKQLPKPRYAAVRTIYKPSPSTNISGIGGSSGDCKDVEILDTSSLVLYFPSPKTVTGEDVLELHIHGGSATVKAVLDAIPKSHSPSGRIRYADPGEFTRRAFLNGRLDLAQVESLSDTLDAETEQQRRAAVRGQSGKLGEKYNHWRDELLYARAEIEALIDFSEDQHFDESPEDLLSSTLGFIRRIVDMIKIHEEASRRSELLRSGIMIALVGPPNVGKSSLMNLIVGREASIVSHEAGTTRDIIEASLDIRGYLCSFADTAGLRGEKMVQDERKKTIGDIEKEGIRRARRKALESDVVIVVASLEKNDKGGIYLKYDPETLDIAAKASKSLLVINKTDLLDYALPSSTVLDKFEAGLSTIGGLRKGIPILQISCVAATESDNLNAIGGKQRKDPGGINSVVDTLVQAFSQMTNLPADLQGLLGVTTRQAQLLSECRTHLEMVLDETSQMNEREGGLDIVLVAEHLRIAAGFLAKLTGRGEAGDVEEVLGVIFEK